MKKTWVASFGLSRIQSQLIVESQSEVLTQCNCPTNTLPILQSDLDDQHLLPHIFPRQKSLQ